MSHDTPQSGRPLTEGDVACAETPLSDLLRRVPKDFVARWEIPEEGRELWQLGSASSPVGALCHRAADRLDALPTAEADRRAEGMEAQGHILGPDKGARRAEGEEDPRLSAHELAILKDMDRHWGHDFGCYAASEIGEETGLAADHRLAVLRVLKHRGLVDLHRGLLTEDGKAFGSGWQITDAGHKALSTRPADADHHEANLIASNAELLAQALAHPPLTADADKGVDAGLEPQWLIMKRGLYYCPNAMGYTGIRDNAGRYSEAEARGHANEASGVTAIREDEAPLIAPKCFDDVAREYLIERQASAASALEAAAVRERDLERSLENMANNWSDSEAKSDRAEARAAELRAILVDVRRCTQGRTLDTRIDAALAATQQQDAGKGVGE